MPSRAPLSVVLCLTALGGCSMAPAYQPPKIAMPAAYKESGTWLVVPAGEAMPASGEWWTAFRDAQLDDLEARVQKDSPTLEAALGRYDQAQADLLQARSGLFPQLGAGVDFTRNRQSDNRPLRGANQPDLYGAADVGGEVSYDIDLWGRIRNTVVASRAMARASGDDLAAIRLSLEARLAASYIALRGYDNEIDLLNSAVLAYAEADRMTRHRFVGGIANAMETGQSGTQLAEAEAQLADLQNARALTEHAIASLVGASASTFAITPRSGLIALPAVPADIPSTLLQRRPDIAAAQQRMIAANARIGAAKAAFFPALSLGGSGGFQSTAIAGLLTAPNLFWSIGPGALVSLFDGGRNRARLGVAKAQWTQATADYRGGVLADIEQVEDGLSATHHLADESEAESRAERQAAQVERLALDRYQKGAVSYLDVIAAQTTALRTRRQSIQLATRRLLASVALFKALGGGWSGQAEADALSAKSHHTAG
ncbi:efflux transporter outer membrane subunit [Novosphingobium sp. G106]|uniref:efflux transporter outer membrane subunit n=1 Tax=Novosphingobium sp. G106 TaxID=2849500 RepID=UPI001C2DB9AE|nr:efflux transporter outer membrane subunit [Novosphingobium sp. G106]MBV1692597.1 efflux transporter outer membrane subunit [Novosphingobium sp. G106]